MADDGDLTEGLYESVLSRALLDRLQRHTGLEAEYGAGAGAAAVDAA